MLTSNLPAAERLARIAIGGALALLVWFAVPQAGALGVAIGLCVAATGLIGFCPACALAGRRPAPRK